MKNQLIVSLLSVSFASLAMAADKPNAAPQTATATVAVGSAPSTRTLTAIAVVPPDINLSTAADFQNVIVQAIYSDGITDDVTDKATYKLDDASLVRRAGREFHPVKDGKTKLTITFGGKTVSMPVSVEKSAEQRPISFRLDVMPVFTKAGCNTGDCHGSARGKDGFHMSLFGYDPAGDHERIVREMTGRRINLAVPADSMLLTKSTGQVQHTGGEMFKADSELYATIYRWLDAGAPNDSADVAKVTGIEVLPHNAVLNGIGAAQGFTVRAKYSDGSDRDITRLARFTTNNERSAKVAENGVVTAGERGEAFIMARFDAFSVGADVIVLPKDLKFTWPKVAEYNYVDTLVDNKLKKLRITPAETCSDEQFLRRVFLDIIGQSPTRAEYEKFMSSKAKDKRALLVDDLLERKEFVDMWVMKWSELLQIRSSNNMANGISYKGAMLYYNWLSEEISSDVPMDKMVQKMLGASGSSFANPPVNFYQTERDNLKMAENVAQVFMGMRIQCAQCHNHPFDRWTMDDYYGFVAFFTQVGRKSSEDPRDQIVFDRGGSSGAKHPVGGRDVQPKFLGGETPDIKGKDRRVALAQWLASPQNPFFAKNLGNMVWAHFMGKGIIHPVDDVRVSNPASNIELLDALGEHFTSYEYDFKKLVRDICNSRTYQLSTRTNPTNELDERNFSHAYIRRIRAEVMLDVISEVTETTRDTKFKSLPQGARAVQIADGKTTNYFLTTFGRAARDSVCSCEVKMEPNLSQALHLLNGSTVNEKIKTGGLVAKALKDKQHPMAIVDDLYIRCLSRRPSPAEAGGIERALADAKDPQPILEDVFWAIMNSKEFIFNH